jgi:FkbM family methyltransferase
MYSQNNEEKVIADYFKDFVGSVLDIGANDGKTLSNSLALIEKGWYGFLVEPSPTAYCKLEDLHYNNEKVQYINAAIGARDSEVIYYDMGEHMKTGDSSLLATLVEGEMKRWSGTEFTKRKVDMITFSTMCKRFDCSHFDFITIDAEGLDIAILRQIDLTNTKLLCIEYNNKPEDEKTISVIVGPDFKLIHKNMENLIYGRIN